MDAPNLPLTNPLRSGVEQEIARAIESMAFLSRCAMHFVARPEQGPPFQFIADQIASLIPSAVILVNDYDPVAHKTILRALAGPAEILSRIPQALGRDPNGLTFEVTPKYHALVAAGRLLHVEGGLHELTFEQLPKDLCGRFEAGFGIKGVYAIPFAIQSDILGTVAILTLCDGHLPEIDVIQAFVHQAAVALQKQRAEDSLRRAEEKYRNIVETAQEGVWIVNSDRRISYVNQRMAELLGYTAAEMIDRPLLEMIADSERNYLAGPVPERRRRGVRERRLLRRDGSTIWCLESICPFGEPTGQTGILGMVTDITARKQVEHDLQEAKERYRLVLELTSDLIFKFRIENGRPILAWATRDLFELLGYSAQNVQNPKDWGPFILAADRPRLQEFHRVLLAGNVGEFEMRTQAMDGRVIWWHVVGRPVWGPDNQVTAIIGAGKDITAGKSAEAVLQRANEEMERRVEIRTAELLRANKLLKEEILERIKAEEALSQRHRAMEAVYEISTKYAGGMESLYDQVVLNISNLLGTPYSVICRLEKDKSKSISQFFGGSIFHEGAVSVRCGPCAEVYRQKRVCQFRGGLRQQFPAAHCFKDYDFRSYVGVPILGREGELLGLLFTVDFKERAFSEYETHLLEIFANYVAHEIERDLMQNRLRYAHEMNVVGQLASGVAHEVRNPLNAILAITEALFQELGERQEFQPYAEHMRDQVNRLSILMQDLLDLGRPIAKMNMRPQSLLRICEEAARQWRQSRIGKQIEIKILPDPESDGIRIHAESTKIQQVFINLFENAAQHSPAQSEIRLHLSASDKETAWVRVLDQGSGIRPDYIDKVFDPFFTTRKGGCGLGLSIVKRLIENHGGSVSIRNNNDGPGCCVEVFLPVFESEQPKQKKAVGD